MQKKNENREITGGDRYVAALAAGLRPPAGQFIQKEIKNMSNTNIHENTLKRLVECLQDAGKDPEQWIVDHLKKSRPMDALETMNSDIRERRSDSCQECKCRQK